MKYGILFICSLWFAGISGADALPGKATLEARIDIAREDVQLTEAALREVDEQIAALERTDGDENVLSDYRAYRDRLRELYQEQAAGLNELVSLLKEHYPESSVTNTVEIPADWELATAPPPTQEVDPSLEQAWRGALAEFDEFLQKETDDISAQLHELESRRSRAVNQKRDAAQEAANRLIERGIEVRLPEEEFEEEEETSPSTEEEEKEEETESTTSSETETHGDPSTDDEVAKTLREAAEQETDPEKKKRLWKEYDEYKASL